MSATAAFAPAAALAAEPPVRQDAYPGYTLRDLLTAVFYHWRALLIAFLVPVVLGLFAALTSHPVFIAQARLLALIGNDYVFTPNGGTAGSQIALDRTQIIEGEVEILQSTTLARETLRDIGIRTVFPSAKPDAPNALEVAAEALQHDLTVTSVPESNVIELSYRNRSALVAAHVLAALLDRYLQRRADVFSRAPGAGIEDQQALFAERLRNAEDALAGFSQAHEISDFDAQVTLLLNRKSVVVADIAANDQQVAQVAAQVAVMQARLAALPRTIELEADSTRDPAVEGLADALGKLQAQRSTLLAHYQDDFPLVKDTDRQIAAVQAQIAASAGASSNGGRTGVNPTWQDLSGQVINLEAQLRGLQAQRAGLQATAEQIQARLDELNAIGKQYRDLKLARDTQAETYHSFLTGAAQTLVSTALDRSRAANVRIVQPPEPPAHGASLRTLEAAAGIVLGIVAACATLVLKIATRQIFVTVRDAEQALDLPVLVTIANRPARA